MLRLGGLGSSVVRAAQRRAKRAAARRTLFLTGGEVSRRTQVLSSSSELEHSAQALGWTSRAPFSTAGCVYESHVLMRFGDQLDQNVRRIELSTCERSNGHPTWGRRLRPSVEARLLCSFRSNCRDLGLFGCSGSPVLCGLCAFGSPRGPGWSPRVMFYGWDSRSKGPSPCRVTLGRSQVGWPLLRSLSICLLANYLRPPRCSCLS